MDFQKNGVKLGGMTKKTVAGLVLILTASCLLKIATSQSTQPSSPTTQTSNSLNAQLQTLASHIENLRESLRNRPSEAAKEFDTANQKRISELSDAEKALEAIRISGTAQQRLDAAGAWNKLRIALETDRKQAIERDPKAFQLKAEISTVQDQIAKNRELLESVSAKEAIEAKRDRDLAKRVPSAQPTIDSLNKFAKRFAEVISEKQSINPLYDEYHASATVTSCDLRKSDSVVHPLEGAVVFSVLEIGHRGEVEKRNFLGFSERSEYRTVFFIEQGKWKLASVVRKSDGYEIISSGSLTPIRKPASESSFPSAWMSEEIDAIQLVTGS